MNWPENPHFFLILDVLTEDCCTRVYRMSSFPLLMLYKPIGNNSNVQ